jgi:DNA (cytosine-5)-methyltransferase 1
VRKPLSKIDDYPVYLESCWQEHLLQHQENAPTVISLFAGCGGSSLGYSMAGFRELLAVEWDDNAVETFKLNFPNVPVYHGDIHDCSVDWILETTGLKPGELDILDGSPPCQGFSTAGKRHITDSRNQLYREYVRILKGLQPKVFVMENVSGMVKGKMKLIFVDIIQELKAAGYKVSARLLNAMYFGVPQSRERMIFIGVREELGIEPSHPVGETKLIPIRQAFIGCNSDNPNYLRTGNVNKIISEMKPGEDGSAASQRLTGNKNKWFNMRRLSWELPGFTITKSEGSSTLVHPEQNRVLNISEFKRIGSYPDDFQFIGKYIEQKMRIGNSVPSLFMRSIANHIRREILDKIPCS